MPLGSDNKKRDTRAAAAISACRRWEGEPYALRSGRPAPVKRRPVISSDAPHFFNELGQRCWLCASVRLPVDYRPDEGNDTRVD